MAGGSWLGWSAGGDEFQAPYFEQGGFPVLLVERAVSEQLLDIGYASTHSGPLPALGTLRLGGESGRSPPTRTWPRSGSSGCSTPSCRLLWSARTHLIGLRIDHVELGTPGSADFAVVDLDTYAAAAPDEVIARGPEVAGHLNSEHHDDLLVLAAHLLDVSANSLAAVRIEWIDSLGLDLAVIDERGSNVFRFGFRRPLTTVDELGGQLRGLFHQAGTEPG